MTTNATLAARAASLLSKKVALAIAEKAMAQALDARRVHPAMATDFGEQLGLELPLKTKEFVAVVGHLLAASEKPLKGAISKRKSEILGILAEVVGALTDTPAMDLPAWALPKPKATKAESAESAEATGALGKANILALAEANAEKAEAAQEMKLADAIALIVANVAALTENQRAMLAAVLAAEAEA